MATSRIWFTGAEKAELWERWKRGSSAAAISRALDRRNKTGVLRIVMLNGGIAPAPRRRALAALLLRPAQSLAARQQRKHQWLGAPVLAKRNKLLAHLPGLSQRDCLATQSTSAKDLGLRNPSR